MNISFIIADNQDVTRAGLHAYITSLFNGAEVVDVADKKALTEELTRDGDRIVILDYALFVVGNGYGDTRKSHPHAAPAHGGGRPFNVDDMLVLRMRYPDVRWILFSNELNEDVVRKFCSLGNVSIIMKDNSGEEIRSAIVCATRGERYLCHQIANLLAGGFAGQGTRHGLTATETEILKLIAKGATVKEIAAERNSSTHTIITHKKNIFRKLGVNNIHEATRYALRAGLVEVMEYYI